MPASSTKPSVIGDVGIRNKVETGTTAMKQTILLTLTSTYLLAASARAEERVVFNRDIRPILSENCFHCHGPDAKIRKGKLRLDTREGALEVRKGKSAAVVAGKSADSELVKRVLSKDPNDIMPPPDSGKKLSAHQIELLRKWIDQGAEWQGHWSFIKPERPQPPTVKERAVIRNNIDSFIEARLEKDGLKLSAVADKLTLIRRVTLDLTGLPPTPAEVDAFLADSSPQAYENLVTRLLNSSRFGEHMGRYWLDLARYGDTHGLHLDNERMLWKYREWVINAFNSNKRFNDFVIEQLAGDLLPGSTIDQRIATGFNRCNVTTSEGGSIDAEVQVRYAVDRTETMGTVFMGMTLGCAVCHDHKFDPIPQKEFYRLMAYFNSAADAAMDGNAIAPPPILRTATPEQEAKLKELDGQVAQIKKKIADTLATVQYTDPGQNKPVETSPREVVWIDDALPPGAVTGDGKPWNFVTAPGPVHSGSKSLKNTYVGVGQQFFTGAAPGLKIGEGDKLFAYVFLDPKTPPRTIMLQFNDGTWEHRAFWGQDLIPFAAGDGPNHKPMGPLPKTGEWVRLEVEAAKVGLKPGAVLNGWAFTQFDGTAHWDKAGIVTRTPQGSDGFDSLAAWDAFERAQKKGAAPQPVRDALKVEEAKRNDAQKKLIRDHFLENVYPKTRATFQPLHNELAAVEKQRKDVDAAIPTTMVMADLPQPRETFLLIRGQYDKKGEKVTHGVPTALSPLPEGAPTNRLGLARWLVDRNHPLTARVAVNRYWQHYFGRGLVKTAEDFGAQGEWPTHPELLDWLAVEFMESGWDVKHLQKLIVTSNAYKQASDVKPEHLKLDPENALISRGPRFRLDAEVVRDSALYVSGLLREQVGGRSVKPYQPPGIWEAIGFNGSNTRDFKRDSGTALYRRSMYTFWKRTAPPPSMMAFDAPSRETCVARRARTNTPLQALVLMNDEQYVEAARGLAERMMAAGTTPADRLTNGFRLAAARRPADAELKLLTQTYERQLARYKAKPEEAKKLLAVGEAKANPALDPAEYAAYTMTANLILNLDEVITKE
jgi:hypothetical protein